MSSGNKSARLLQLALPLVNTHGFTREALARSVLELPPPETHNKPLPDNAVTALFGEGDIARRRLINAWLDRGIHNIQSIPSGTTLRQALHSRLEYNKPALPHLPEAFALLAFPTRSFPPLDIRPALSHAFQIADEACRVTQDASLQLAWYARRTSIAGIYIASELHQLTSPNTAHGFMDSLLEQSSSIESTLEDAGIFSSYLVKSWKNIIRSSGIL